MSVEGFKEILSDCKQAIDEIFGEGYAEANPALTIKLLSVKTKFSKKPPWRGTTLETPVDPIEAAVKDFITSGELKVLASAQNNFIATSQVVDRVMQKLAVKKNKRRAMNTLVGKALAKHLEQYARQTQVRGPLGKLRGYRLDDLQE